MIDTLTSKIGFNVVELPANGSFSNLIQVFEGHRLIAVEAIAPVRQYEAARLCKKFRVIDVFTTKAGHQYCIWTAGGTLPIRFITFLGRREINDF